MVWWVGLPLFIDIAIMSQRSRALVSHGRLVGRYLWKQVQWEMRRPLTTSLQVERTMSLPQSGLAVFGFVLLCAIHSFWGRGRRRRERGSHLTPPLCHPRVKAYHKPSQVHSDLPDLVKSLAAIPRLRNVPTDWIFNLFNVLKTHFSSWLSFLLLLLAGDVELNPGPYGSKHKYVASTIKLLF